MAANVPAGEEYPVVWHKTHLRVPLFEVDLGQAVYHGNYYHLFELARESFLRDLGYSYKRFMDQELHLTIVEATCNYRRPLHYDDEIEVHTGILWRRSRSLAFVQHIYRLDRDSDPVLCTKAVLNMVCVRFTGSPTVLPQELVQLMEKWTNEDGAQPPYPGP